MQITFLFPFIYVAWLLVSSHYWHHRSPWSTGGPTNEEKRASISHHQSVRIFVNVRERNKLKKCAVTVDESPIRMNKQS